MAHLRRNDRLYEAPGGTRPRGVLQFRLLENPEAGDVEPGTSGLRKIRLGDPTRGKGTRGGARAHYLWLRHKRVIYLLYVYSKNEASTLSAEQKRQLRDIVARIKQES